MGCHVLEVACLSGHSELARCVSLSVILDHGDVVPGKGYYAQATYVVVVHVVRALCKQDMHTWGNHD